MQQRAIILMDDVAFSGTVLRTVTKKFLERGIAVMGVRSAISTIASYDYFNSVLPIGLKCGYVMGEEVIDQICERDFYFGVAQSGISIKGKNGFALASYIRKYFPQILMVFLTGHAGFALEGYDYEPVDFLVKPIINERFAQTLKRVERKLAGISDETRKPRIGFYTDK